MQRTWRKSYKLKVGRSWVAHLFEEPRVQAFEGKFSYVLNLNLKALNEPWQLVKYYGGKYSRKLSSWLGNEVLSLCIC